MTMNNLAFLLCNPKQGGAVRVEILVQVGKSAKCGLVVGRGKDCRLGVCLYVYVFLCICVYVCVCGCLCVCVCICVCVNSSVQ
jgi:hypothetical protein